MKRYASSGIIGLHFTQEELFLAHGQRTGQTFHVGSMDVIDITQHMLEGGEYNTLTLGPMIEEAVRSQRIKTRKAIISFPVKFPWIRVIDVPVMSQREMARIVRLEVERLYLDSTVEKLIDFFPLDDAKDKGPGGTMPVLSCAIPKNSVAPYIDLLEAANLELIGIDLVEVNVLKMAALQGVDFNDGITLIIYYPDGNGHGRWAIKQVSPFSSGDSSELLQIEGYCRLCNPPGGPFDHVSVGTISPTLTDPSMPSASPDFAPGHIAVSVDFDGEASLRFERDTSIVPIADWGPP